MHSLSRKQVEGVNVFSLIYKGKTSAIHFFHPSFPGSFVVTIYVLSSNPQEIMSEVSAGGNSYGKGAGKYNDEQIIEMEIITPSSSQKPNDNNESVAYISVQFLQKIIAEVFGTYFLVFAGCGSVVINNDKGSITFPGVAIVFGLVVMVMVYAVGHISGAHFNPAVTLAFSICRRFPWREVPAYIIAQMMGATLASGTLRLMFGGGTKHFGGTVPMGSNLQSLVLEFIVTFYLMFVISGVATDTRAIGELAGIAVGATILLNVLVAGPISGASMNPARSLGPAIVANQYDGVWIYILGPICGAVSGAFAYNLIRFTDKPLRELTKSGSFLKSLRRNASQISNYN